MPTAEAGDKKTGRGGPMPAAPEPEQRLPCPRCDSTNTKFCYFNNYNMAQPRHFCKSCRRYWTQGGTLRDIPVGGGSRSSSASSSSKHSSNKRSRTSSATSAPTSSSSTAPATSSPSSAAGLSSDLTPLIPPDLDVHIGSFSSLLSTTSSPALLSLGDPFLGRAAAPSLGLDGFGFAFGFGLGRAPWPAPDVADGAWQMGIGEAIGDADCFSWLDLAISTPANGCLQ